MAEPTNPHADKQRWYAASALFVTRWRDAPDECPLVEERVYLVQAAGDDAALEKAICFAKQEEPSDYRFTFADRAAREEFVGIRKLISVRPHVNAARDADDLSDGCELTFTFFELQSRDDLQALIEAGR